MSVRYARRGDAVSRQLAGHASRGVDIALPSAIDIIAVPRLVRTQIDQQ